MSIQVLYPFFIFFGVELFVFLKYFGHHPLIGCINGKYLVPFSRLSFHFVVSLAAQKTFYFDVVPFVYFFFYLLCLRRHIIPQKILLRVMSKSLLPMFSSRSFMVSSFTFKSLIHFEFIFVYGIRKWSSFFVCVCVCMCVCMSF